MKQTTQSHKQLKKIQETQKAAPNQKNKQQQRSQQTRGRDRTKSGIRPWGRKVLKYIYYNDYTIRFGDLSAGMRRNLLLLPSLIEKPEAKERKSQMRKPLIVRAWTTKFITAQPTQRGRIIIETRSSGVDK